MGAVVSVDKSLQHLWPPGTFSAQPKAADPRKGRKPGAQQTKQVTRVIGPPDKNGKRKTRTVKPKPPPGPYKVPKSTPGSRQQPSRTKKQQGK
jgi:hypothetical protein